MNQSDKKAGVLSPRHAGIKNRSNKQHRKRNIRSDQELELNNMLVKGEKIILCARVHGALYWRSVAVLLIAVVLFFYIPALSAVIGAAGVIMLCVAMLTKYYLLLVVTNKRVLARYGLLQMDVVDIRLSRIESIDLERMLLGHIFGYANVVVAGTGQRVIRVPYIANSEAFRRFYNEMVLVDEGNEEAEKEIKKIKEAVDDAKEQREKPKNKV